MYVFLASLGRVHVPPGPRCILPRNASPPKLRPMPFSQLFAPSHLASESGSFN